MPTVNVIRLLPLEHRHAPHPPGSADERAVAWCADLRDRACLR